jgi:threonine dehydratase
MPADAYPNKIQACRDEGAEVVLCPTREAAEAACAQHLERGAVLVHPYDAARTMEGAGTVGLEIAEDWPEVDVAIFPCGGGGLLGGSSLALRRALGQRVYLIGCEPEGAPSMARGVAAGRQVDLVAITTRVQGLCPLNSGALPIAVVAQLVDRLLTLDDEAIFAAQAHLVRSAPWPVEPAGAAAFAVVHAGRLPEELLEGRSAKHPLRVAAVVSGANADPAQLEALRAGG